MGKKVELVGQRSRSQSDTGPEAGPSSETEVPEPKWDRRAEPLHGPKIQISGDDGDRTHDLRLAKPALYQLSYIPAG